MYFFSVKGWKKTFEFNKWKIKIREEIKEREKIKCN